MNEKRWVAIASSIKGSIQRGELSHGDRIATDTEMAVNWNVSRVTVQRALSELQREGWVVRRRKAGTTVADKKSLPPTKIALVFSTPTQKPQSDYIDGIVESLGSGYQVLKFDSRTDPREEAKCLETAAADCDAMICYASCDPENTALINTIASKIPVVLVDRAPEGVSADTIMTDNSGSMLMGLKHLHAQGHRRIAYFMLDLLSISSVRERYSAYIDFMKQEVGLENPAQWERRFPVKPIPRGQFLSTVETALAELLTLPEPITAVACQQDIVLNVLLESCMHLGVRVPDDLAILSFVDNAEGAMPLEGSVHRLAQRSAEMGHMAARRIQQRLTSSPGTPPQMMRFMTDLYPAQAHEMSPIAKKYAARLKR